jgi:endonuclease YncB( thermonuclease family)
MHFLLTFALAVAATAQTSRSPHRSESLAVRAVIDGDTIEVATIGRVRLLGIAAPDVTTSPIGRSARDRLAALVLHHWVRLEWEVTASGGLTRHRACVVREDGVFVNALLVREGLARLSTRLPRARVSELREAEQDARRSRRGLWGQAGERGAVAPKRPARYTAGAGRRKHRQASQHS